MRKSNSRWLCLFLVLAAAGCQEQVTNPASPEGANFSLQDGDVRLDRRSISLPATLRMTDQALAEAAGRAINPGDYVCPASTDVIDWFIGEVNEFIAAEPSLFVFLYFNRLADLVPTYDALLFETTATPQTFGYNGEYTKVVGKAERDVKGFWDIDSDAIQVIGMHGTMLQDVSRVAAVYRAVFGLPPATANLFATQVRNAVLQSQIIDGGNHPLFSFNAFAVSDPAGSIPDKIVLGDGILAGYEAVGFGDVAPQAIFAHEFAHHIQFQNDYFNDAGATTGSAAEQGRYVELMADAMSAYYLTHKRGATMNQKRVEQFLQVFFQIGDCAFGSSGHHGTPNQRMAAARFGFAVADEAQKQGHILTSEEFHARFVAAYPQLIAPDA